MSSARSTVSSTRSPRYFLMVSATARAGITPIWFSKTASATRLNKLVEVSALAESCTKTMSMPPANTASASDTDCCLVAPPTTTLMSTPWDSSWFSSSRI